jgi:hypothetical protein
MSGLSKVSADAVGGILQLCSDTLLDLELANLDSPEFGNQFANYVSHCVQL